MIDSLVAAFNDGITAAAFIVERAAIAQTSTGRAAVGEMPETIPASVLEDIYNKIMAAKKP